MPEPLSKDTQAVLLLCGRFAPREAMEPLDLREYNRVVDLLRRQSLRSAVLLDRAAFDLDWDEAGIDRDRLQALLGRGMALGLAAERWVNGGLWVLSRSDDDYPSRLRLHLGRSAPPLLWGVGERRLLEGNGIAIVGSRDVDDEAVQWAEQLAIGCASRGLAVISGGARGTDQVALASTLHAGGLAVGVLPEGLGKPAVVSRYREAIVAERLVLISPFYPDAGFNVGNAMARNKIIYGLARAAVIVRADAKKGGTWAGAEEELRRDNRIPLFVRASEPMAEGNRALLAMGARAFADPSRDNLEEFLFGVSEPAYSVLRDAPGPVPPPRKERPHSWLPAELQAADGRKEDESGQRPTIPAHETTSSPMAGPLPGPQTVYEAIVPLLLRAFAEPATLKTAAERLEVQEKQLKEWVERAVAAGQLVKTKDRPSEFVVRGGRDGGLRARTRQVSLFGTKEGN